VKPEDIAKMNEAVERDREEILAEERERLSKLSRIPTALKGATLKRISPFPYKEKFVTWTKRAFDAKQKGKSESGLYLYGPYGSGKTSLAAIAALWGNQVGIFSLYLKFTDLFLLQRDNPEWVKDTAGMWDYAQRVPMLVVDDIFRRFKDNWGRGNLYAFESLLETRINSGLTMNVFTSNISEEELEDDELARIYTLLQESCYFLKVEGMNYRELATQIRKEL
jgi:primosomal protein DnaI